MAVNDTVQSKTGPPGELPVVACAACAHPWAEHDQIAARFCAATTAGRYERGCVCTMGSSTTT